MTEVVLIVGAGEGLSASLARRFAREGARIVLAARTPVKLRDVATATRAQVVRCDATVPTDVEALALRMSWCTTQADDCAARSSTSSRRP